ncbi:hypothetical protein [Porphyromonas miyakawae]|uniref:hypothetical protein n=1 Tax=Porphyromonas miyakawae TaxID=3137470 RepID=UPI00398C6415
MKQTKDTKSKPAQGSTNRPSKGHTTMVERLEALKRYYINGYSVKLLASQYEYSIKKCNSYL